MPFSISKTNPPWQLISESTLYQPWASSGSGDVMFEHSTTVFADGNLGEGATATLRMKDEGGIIVEYKVVLHWLAWNHFSFEIVEEVTSGD